MADFENWTEISTVGDLLIRAARLESERDAVVFPDRRVTYAALLEGAIETARGLVARGLMRGEHVGLLLTNSVEFLHGLFGAALAGCVAVPLNARHKTAELAYIVEHADLAAILTSTAQTDYVDFSQVLHAALPSLSTAGGTDLVLPEAPRLRSVILLDGRAQSDFVAADRFYREAQAVDHAVIEARRRGVRIRDVAVLIYTSGTTAHPKGCMLTHEALTRGPVERARHRLGRGRDDVAWAAGPLFHIGSLAPFIGSVGATGTFLTDTYFDPGRALALMARERVTVAWPWFSAIVQGLLDHPDFRPADFASLRSLFMIAPPALVARVQRTFPDAEILQACGMTETAGVFALSDRAATVEERTTKQGKPAPGVDIRIRDLAGDETAPPGTVGEILVRGYCVMNGYYRDSKRTAEALDRDGWLHTGDLYAQEADGNLVFHGRLKDMLKVGGENVAAIEVEAFLCRHADVKIAEVVGRPDRRLDEVPVAFVELRPGSTIGEEELIAFCRGRIASYKIPRAIYFMGPDDWPMSATKVDKRALRQRVLTG